MFENVRVRKLLAFINITISSEKPMYSSHYNGLMFEQLLQELPLIPYNKLTNEEKSAIKLLVKNMLIRAINVRNNKIPNRPYNDWYKKIVDDTIALLKSYRFDERVVFLGALIDSGLKYSAARPEKYIQPPKSARNTVLSIPELQRKICLYL